MTHILENISYFICIYVFKMSHFKCGVTVKDTFVNCKENI